MNLQGIVYLSDAEFTTLTTNGTLTKNGRTITYNENVLYITPTSVADKIAHTLTVGQYEFDGSADVSVPLKNVEYIEGTWSSSTSSWTGVSTDSALYDGKQIVLYLPYAASASTAVTLNLTLSDGTTTGAKRVYFEGTTGFLVQKGAYSHLHLIYHPSLSISGTSYDGWWYLQTYDTKPNSLYVTYTHYKTKTALGRYVLLLTQDEEYLLPTTAADNDTGTSKTLTTASFDPFGQIYLFNSTSALAADANINYNSAYTQTTVLDLRYSFNTGTTLTSYESVYLVCVPQPDGTVKLHSTPIAQSLPSTEDGLVYKYLGQAYNTYQITLNQDKPCYIFKNGAIRLYTHNMTNEVSPIEFVIGTQSSATDTLLGTVNNIHALTTGTTLMYRTPYAIPGTNAATLTLTLGTGGSATSAIPLYIDDATTSTTPYAAGSIIMLTYYNNRFYVINQSYADGDGGSY